MPLDQGVFHFLLGHFLRRHLFTEYITLQSVVCLWCCAQPSLVAIFMCHVGHDVIVELFRPRLSTSYGGMYDDNYLNVLDLLYLHIISYFRE